MSFLRAERVWPRRSRPGSDTNTEPLYLRSLIDASLVSLAPAVAEEELTQPAKAFSSADALSQRFARRLLFVPRLLLKIRGAPPDGRQHIVSFLFADDLIGLAQNGVYVNSAEAVTAGTLYKIPTAALEPRLLNYYDLVFQVISKMCHELREAQRHAVLLSEQHAIAKAGFFLQVLETHQATPGRKHGRGLFANDAARVCRHHARGGDTIAAGPRQSGCYRIERSAARPHHQPGAIWKPPFRELRTTR